MIFVKDIFLSKHLKKNTYKLSNYKDNFKFPDDCEFAYIKIQYDYKKNLELLKKNFYLVDISVKLKIDLNKYKIKKTLTCIAKESDKKDILKIANDSFVYDRFHTDLKISNKVASKIKKEWVNNFFNGYRGDQCFVVKKNKKVIGFLLSIKKDKKALIDLIAVDLKFRNLGIGRDLINYMINFYKKEIDQIEVGTQISNQTSIDFYQKIGFKFNSYNLTYHYHKK